MKKSFRQFFVLLASAAFSAPAWGSGRTSPPAAPFDLIAWNGGKFVYGVDYYPEAWDESRWEKDAAMMQAAGINFVRLAEFAWVKMEPEEGHFDFAWLDRALKVLNTHGIRAVLGTPTAAPPAWLYAKYPDIAAMDEHGVRYRFGSRQNVCLNNPNFRAAVRRIVTAMAEHYKDHPGVLGWQIDNELGGPNCYDGFCQAAFQKWCQTKYQSLAALNHAWGTIFWGHTYTAWTQIPLPWNTLYEAHSPSLALDYKRFFSDSTDDYLKLQAGILRRISPSKAITHNEMGLFDGIDYSKLNESLDFVAWDNYPMFESDYTSFYGPALGHDLTRGSKYNQNFMVMEEQGGLPGWQIFWGRQAPAALYRLWAYQAVAHGADAVCFFRWRTSRYGTEQYWQGVLDQDSYPNARYQIVKQMGGELPKLTELLQGSKVASHVALLVSPDSRWAFHIQPLVEGAGAPGGSKVNFDYNRELRQYYDAVRRLGLNVDVVFPQTDFSAYKAIIAPSLFVTDPALVARLKQFVEQGGTLALTYRSGVKDEHNVVTDKTLPGPLAELAGVAIHEFDPQTNQEQEIEAGDAGRFPARVWFDILEPATAEVLATYTKGYYAGKAAVTRNRVGRGTVYYVGTESSSDAFYDHEAEALAKEVGIAIGPKLPVGVEMVTREKGGNPIVFLLNYTESAQTVKLDGTYRNALTGEAESGAISIPPLDVKILSASK